MSRRAPLRFAALAAVAGILLAASPRASQERPGPNRVRGGWTTSAAAGEDRRVAAIVNAASQARARAAIRELESFQTRDATTASQDRRGSAGVVVGPGARTLAVPPLDHES